jgi:hypothetical protein
MPTIDCFRLVASGRGGCDFDVHAVLAGKLLAFQPSRLAPAVRKRSRSRRRAQEAGEDVHEAPRAPPRLLPPESPHPSHDGLAWGSSLLLARGVLGAGAGDAGELGAADRRRRLEAPSESSARRGHHVIRRRLPGVSEVRSPGWLPTFSLAT